jgi:hypothetical protein
MRLGFYITGLYGWANLWSQLAEFQDSAGGLQILLSVNETTHEFCVNFNVAWAPLASGGLLVLNQWTCIEMWYLVANAPNGRVVVKQDGVIIIDYTGDTQQTGLTEIKVLRLGRPVEYGFEGYVDDLAVNDTAGAVNNSWIGRGGIYPVFPEGVGAYTDLHAFGHANPWDCISEVPPDDADYVYDDTVDQKSVYAMSALVPTTGTIACINVIMRAKLDAAGTGNIARLIRSNGVDSQGADVGLDTSPKTIQENIETDPSGGGAWTIARVNALEAGAVVR